MAKSAAMVAAGKALSFSRPARRAKPRPAERIPVCVEPPTSFVEGPGPGRDWWEKALSEKSFSGSKRGNKQQNRDVGAKSRTTNLGPFGEVIRSTGPMAKVNPIRFSTKYQDDESDLIMYPYRPYKASTGTWLSRDPMQELGGLNLYEFADNDGINKADSDGRELIEGGEAIIADLAVQISVNYATGEHWYNISVTSVAVAAGLGLIGIPDIKDTGQLISGVFKAGKISATVSKKAYKLELLSNPKSIAKLNAELDKMTAEQSKTLMQTLKTGGLIGVGTAVPMAAEKIADAAETGIVTMPGCPNPGYGGIINVNIVQTVYYYVPPGN